MRPKYGEGSDEQYLFEGSDEQYLFEGSDKVQFGVRRKVFELRRGQELRRY